MGFTEREFVRVKVARMLMQQKTEVRGWLMGRCDAEEHTLEYIGVLVCFALLVPTLYNFRNPEVYLRRGLQSDTDIFGRLDNF